MKKLIITVLFLSGCSSVEKNGTWEGGVEAKAKIEPAKPTDEKIEVTVSLKRKW